MSICRHSHLDACAPAGIHISNLPFVVNFDFPGSIENYAHRPITRHIREYFELLF